MALLTFRVLSIPPLAAHLNEPPLNPTHSTDIVPSSSWKIYIDVNGGDDKVRIERINIKISGGREWRESIKRWKRKK